MSQTDLFVIGGAVGATWGGPAGWAAFLHVPALGQAFKLTGHDTGKTQQTVDLYPLIAAIQWYHDQFWVAGRRTSVLCVTDSHRICEIGRTPELRGSFDWTFITWFERRGYQIEWAWQSRQQNQVVFDEAERARGICANRLHAG